MMRLQVIHLLSVISKGMKKELLEDPGRIKSSSPTLTPYLPPIDLPLSRTLPLPFPRNKPP
jgi:hypothetical protein